MCQEQRQRTMKRRLKKEKETELEGTRKEVTCGELHFSAIFYTHLKSHTERKLRSSKAKCSRKGGGKGEQGAKGSENAAVAAVSKQERQTAMPAKINACKGQRERETDRERERWRQSQRERGGGRDRVKEKD